MAIKRLHYFDQQFLVEGDFTDEQKYHVDMRRRHTRLLHSFGIAEGLTVRRTGAREVTVDPGVAIDLAGRELILETPEIRDLSNLTNFPANTPVFITIAYHEDPTDPVTATGVTGNTRITEAPHVEATTTAPPTDGSVVRLAQFTKTSGGDVPTTTTPPTDALDGGVRQSPSAKTAAGAITDVQLASGAVTGAKLAINSVDASKIVDGAITLAKLGPNSVDGSKIVDASIGGGKLTNSGVTSAKIGDGAVISAKIGDGAVTDPKIAGGTISESKLTAALLAKINAPSGLASLNGAVGEGGNINLVGNNAIQVTVTSSIPNIGPPTNGEGDQIQISENHSTRTGNVHGLTATQLGAIGALLSTQYDHRLRNITVISFTAGDANGKQIPITLSFAPRIVVAVSSCGNVFGSRLYGGGSFGFFDVTANPTQRCFGFGMTWNSNADWFPRMNAPTAGVCSATFFDGGSAPAKSEDLMVSVAASGNTLTATLTRTIVGAGAPLNSFQLLISLYIMGS